MISYATSGATYGLGFFLPFIVLTFAMSVVVQEMCMRVGAVTHRGYGQLVLERFGRVWGWFNAGDLIFTNLVTLIAEFVAIRVGLAYFHLSAAGGRAAGGAAGGVHAEWRALLALGADRAGNGPLQRPVPGGRDRGQPELGVGGPRVRDVLAAPRRKLQHRCCC